MFILYLSDIDSHQKMNLLIYFSLNKWGLSYLNIVDWNEVVDNWWNVCRIWRNDVYMITYTKSPLFSYENNKIATSKRWNDKNGYLASVILYFF